MGLEELNSFRIWLVVVHREGKNSLRAGDFGAEFGRMSGNLPEGNEGREKSIQQRKKNMKKRKTFSAGINILKGMEA